MKIGLVQEQWLGSPDKQAESLADGIYDAAKQGAKVVCLQEMTLNSYFPTKKDLDPTPFMEEIGTGPTSTFMADAAKKSKVFITGSIFTIDGYNTAIAFGPDGELVGSTKKQHIPKGEKYHEDYYFKPGDSDYPLHEIAGHKMALPTCYDQWFPELSRIYGLKGAEVIIYPTAIGAEPTAPGFDSQPLWQKVMVAQGIMANSFIVAINRFGTEDGLEFYGSSFISNPIGEILAQAPRDKRAVLVTDLDFEQRDLWGRLFPFADQREPHTYKELVKVK